MFAESDVSPTRYGLRMNMEKAFLESTTYKDQDTLVPPLDPPTSEGNSTSVPRNAASNTMRAPKMKVIKESTWDDKVREYFEIPLVQLIESDSLAYEFNVALGIYAVVVVRQDHLFEVTRP